MRNMRTAASQHHWSPPKPVFFQFIQSQSPRLNCSVPTSSTTPVPCSRFLYAVSSRGQTVRLSFIGFQRHPLNSTGSWPTGSTACPQNCTPTPLTWLACSGPGQVSTLMVRSAMALLAVGSVAHLPPIQTFLSNTRCLHPCISNHRLDFIRGLWSKFSCFFNLVRVLSLVFRFMYNCRLPPSQRLTRPPTFEEIERSKFTIYRLAQSEHYDDVPAKELNRAEKSQARSLQSHPVQAWSHSCSEQGSGSRGSHTAYPTDRPELQVALEAFGKIPP